MGCYDLKGRLDLLIGKFKYSRVEFWKSIDKNRNKLSLLKGGFFFKFLLNYYF